MTQTKLNDGVDTSSRIKSSAKEVGSITAAIISASTYFFVAHLGAQSLEKLIENSADSDNEAFIIAAYALSVGACICFGAFTYKAFSNLNVIPKQRMSIVLSALAPMSSSSFFTACLLGSQAMGASLPVAISLALALYASRTLTMIDGSVKFPEKSRELIDTLQDSMSNKDIINILRLIVTLYTAIGFSLASTDNIFSAVSFLLGECDVPNGMAKDIPSYIVGTLGAIGLFPMIMYWTYRGILQLTRGGKADQDGINQNPTDIYTIFAAIATIPVIMGSFGSLTSTSGRMFGLTGNYGKPIELSAAIIYSVGGAVPGLSTIFRATPKLVSSCGSMLSSSTSTLFSKVRIRPERSERLDEEIPLMKERKKINS